MAVKSFMIQAPGFIIANILINILFFVKIIFVLFGGTDESSWKIQKNFFFFVTDTLYK